MCFLSDIYKYISKVEGKLKIVYNDKEICVVDWNVFVGGEFLNYIFGFIFLCLIGNVELELFSCFSIIFYGYYYFRF